MTTMERARQATAVERSPRRSAFERVYGIVVAFKGLDGTVELVVGLLLLLAPGVVRLGLQGTAAEAREHVTPLRSFVAGELLRADQVVASGVAVLAVVLLVHGAVKVVTVYCLLRRILAAYPWAVLVLAALLVWQLAVLVTDPTTGSAVLALLDVAVLGLVAREWRLLADRRRRAAGTEGEG